MKYVLILSLFLILLAAPALADMVLVVHKDNPVSSLSGQEAKQIFLGKKGAWSNGQAIVLYSQFDRTVTDEFSRAVVDKSAQQFDTYWKKALFTGTGRPPIAVQDDAEMKRFIAADPRGIGYIARGSLDASVKAVTLN